MDSRTLIVSVFLAACAGPDPRVRGAVATRSPTPGATRVALDIDNHAGPGTIEIDIELRDTAGNVIRAQRTLGLASRQSVHFETDVETPPGSYTVRASAQYPD